MRNLIFILILVAIPSWASATTCNSAPLEEQLSAAPIVFVATITSASSSGPFSMVVDGSTYRVIYNFEVRERIKGDPTLVTSLFTNNMFNDYASGITWDGPDTRLLPGDTVLVVANAPGDVQVAACTGSRRWKPTQEQLKTLRSLVGPPPNIAFKPTSFHGPGQAAGKACHLPHPAARCGLT